MDNYKFNIKELYDFHNANKKTLKDLVNEIKRGNVVPFIGAGMSAPIYPTWEKFFVKTLSNDNIRQEKKESIKALLKKNKYERAASVLHKELGEREFIRVIRDIFDESKITAEKYEDMAVTLIPQIFSDKTVITTNFDRLLERVFKDKECEFKGTLSPYEPSENVKGDFSQGIYNYLLKLHGDYLHTDKMAFAESKYDEYYGKNLDSEYVTFISNALSNRVLLFLGCGLEVDRTMSLLEKIATSFSRTHYAVVECPSDSLDDDVFHEKQKRLANMGILCIWYPKEKHEFVKTILLELPSEGKKKGTLPTNNLPFSRNHHFVGREQVFEKICKAFENNDAISLTQAIKGMGGVGKTQTALEYAYRYADRYSGIWWVTSETEFAVISEYRQFAIEMGLLSEQQQDKDVIIRAVLAWMDRHNRWLFIYDNVESLSGNTRWWPRDNRNHILITTRNKINPIEQIDIDVFEKEEAIEFLEKRTRIKNDTENASTLAERLGYLPLALEQAAAYIANDSSFEEYLSLLDEYGLELLEKVDGMIYDSSSVKVTFDISIKKINLDSARQLLYLCSYMASKDIDEALFSENAELLPAPLGEVMQSRLKSKDVWKELTRYSLLKKQEDGNGYSMHRLLQEVVRNKIIEKQQWALYCLIIFAKTYDFIYGDIVSHNRFLQLTPHVESCVNTTETILTFDEGKEGIARLYHTGGIGLSNLGYYNKALKWFEKILIIREKVLDLEHPDIAATYHNIAFVYSEQGDYPKALELYQKALKIREKVLGLEHPDTVSNYINIAGVYDSQGDYHKALELYQKALKINENVLGLKHPHTAATYHNIAGMYLRQGDYPMALEGFQKALEIHKEVLGLEHPNTAIFFNSIAFVYSKQGNYHKALECYHKALEIREKVLGLEHPDTTLTYNDIATMYSRQGDYLKALEWYQKALEICENVLGLEHPNTATSYNNISFVYFSQGNFLKALELLQKALKIREKVLGLEHPNTIETKKYIKIVRNSLN